MASAQRTSRDRGPGSYHHRALRAALVDGARQILRERGHDAFSLNELARRVGVSPGAVYRHFDNREALLRAVSFEGYGELQRALTAPLPAAADAGQRLLELGVRYVVFAAENTDLFLTMFRFRPSSDQDMRGADPFAPLVAAVVAAQEAGRFPAGDARRLAAIVWSSLHGLAVLFLNGAFPSLGLADDLPAAARDHLRTQFPQLLAPRSTGTTGPRR